jgi:hypothetical protein
MEEAYSTHEKYKNISDTSFGEPEVKPHLETNYKWAVNKKNKLKLIYNIY